MRREAAVGNVVVGNLEEFGCAASRSEMRASDEREQVGRGGGTSGGGTMGDGREKDSN